MKSRVLDPSPKKRKTTKKKTAGFVDGPASHRRKIEPTHKKVASKGSQKGPIGGRKHHPASPGKKRGLKTILIRGKRKGGEIKGKKPPNPETPKRKPLPAVVLMGPKKGEEKRGNRDPKNSP